MGSWKSSTAERLEDRDDRDLEAAEDPVWAAFLRAPMREETPEERAAFEAAKALGGSVDGAEVDAADR